VTLSAESISRLAERLRLDPIAFDRCLPSEATNALLAHDASLLPDDELRGLPTTYIGNKQFVGVPTEAALRDALERARTAPVAAPSGTVFAALLGGLLVLVGFLGRRRGH
jgi:protein-disulfide isomerase